MQYSSRAIPAPIKRAVLARDGMQCRHCGTAVIHGGGRDECFVSNYLHFDHLKPWALGGDHTVENLVVSCARCNLGRRKPEVNERKGRLWVEYRYGKYWWPEDFTPPRLVDPDRCAFLLTDYAAMNGRHVLAVVRDIHAGLLPATGQGEPIHVEAPDMQATRVRRGRRRLS